jgi:hypothetical protein
MNKKIIHPLWVHLPAILIIVALVIIVVLSGPLPEQAPTHFDINGQPNSYGSPLFVVIAMMLLMIFFIVLSVFIDELWARQEKKKSFNWLSLFDDVVVGAMGGTMIAYIKVLALPDYVFTFPWFECLLVCGLAVILAVILEWLRPYRKYEFAIVAEDVEGIKSNINEIMKSGQPLVYWESQNPLYNSILATVLPLVFLGVAIAVSFLAIWVAVIYVVLALISFMLYGGFRTIITGDRIVIKMGVIGIPLLKLNMADITAAETHSFSPLKDFGGYGIRLNREMKAYYLSGNQGVKLTMSNGKKYLIGSDHPDRLAIVVNSLIK